MARRCVTYLEAGPAPRVSERTEVALGPPAEPAAPRPRRRRRRSPWPVLAGAAVVVLLVWSARPGGDPAPLRSPEPTRPARTVLPAGDGAVPDASAVLPAAWTGELRRDPDGRGASPAPRVHALSVARPDASASALVVVDATRRAFPGAPRPAGPRERPLRVLGPPDGTGLRTWQWDEAGYGISLTSVGLTPTEQRRVALALDVPGGPSLVSGRTPTFDLDVLDRAGLAVVEVLSGPASPSGGPLIGQPGGASIGAELFDAAGRTVLLNVVQAPVVTADAVRRALGAPADPPAVPGAIATVVLAHEGTAPEDVHVRGWARVLVDLPGPATVELSSDVVGADELLALARATDLGRLARAVGPPR